MTENTRKKKRKLFRPPNRTGWVAIIAPTLLIAVAVFSVQLQRQLAAAKDRVAELEEKLDRLTHHRDAVAEDFPHTSEMVDAFRTLSFEKATRFAENLVFAYPADGKAYEKMLVSFNGAVNTCLDSGRLMEAARLVNWMTVIQDRQPMVLNGEQSMSLYLESIDGVRKVREQAVAIAHTEMAGLNGNLLASPNSTAAGIEELVQKGASLILVANLFGDDELGAEGMAFLENLELLATSVPADEAGPEELLTYLKTTLAEMGWMDPLLPAAEKLLQQRVALVAGLLATQLSELGESPEVIAWTWLALDDLESFFASANGNDELQQVWGNTVAWLQQEVETEITALLNKRSALEMSSEEFEAQLMPLSQKLERVDTDGAMRRRLVRAQQEIEEKFQRGHFDSQVQKLEQRLRRRSLDDFDFEGILIDVALLPQPSTDLQMASYLQLSRRVQVAEGKRERKRMESRIQDYNRWAFSLLRNEATRMDGTSRSDRTRIRVAAAKTLAEIQPSFLNRVVLEYYNEVYAESMMGLDEEEKLEVYQHWVRSKPRGLDGIPSN